MKQFLRYIYEKDDTVKQFLSLAMANGEAEILVHFPGGQKAPASRAAGKHCSNCRAETEVIMQAASIAQTSDHDSEQAVFLSDALSFLQAHQKHKLPNFTKAYSKLQLPKGLFYSGFQPIVKYDTMSKRTSLQRWVPEENSLTTMSAKRRPSSER